MLFSFKIRSFFKDKLLDAIAAREEQCRQLEKDIDQLTCLLSETENEVAEKAEAIAALERKLKAGNCLVVLAFDENSIHNIILLMG